MEVDGQLLRDVDRIRGIPTTIVQGRYDVVCPMRSAWDLHKAFPEADLRIVNGILRIMWVVLRAFQILVIQ